jgi:hypothetical protein
MQACKQFAHNILSMLIVVGCHNVVFADVKNNIVG